MKKINMKHYWVVSDKDREHFICKIVHGEKNSRLLWVGDLINARKFRTRKYARMFVQAWKYYFEKSDFRPVVRKVLSEVE